MRQKYEQPGDFVVFAHGVKNLMSNLFGFMFTWYYFLSDIIEKRRLKKLSAESKEIETFDELMDSAEEHGDEDRRFSQIASQMRGDDSEMEREIYIEYRFREIVKMILSIILTLGVCSAIALMIVGIGSVIVSALFS